MSPALTGDVSNGLTAAAATSACDVRASSFTELASTHAYGIGATAPASSQTLYELDMPSSAAGVWPASGSSQGQRADGSGAAIATSAHDGQ
jgi:hypothetical protein